MSSNELSNPDTLREHYEKIIFFQQKLLKMKFRVELPSSIPSSSFSSVILDSSPPSSFSLFLRIEGLINNFVANMSGLEEFSKELNQKKEYFLEIEENNKLYLSTITTFEDLQRAYKEKISEMEKKEKERVEEWEKKRLLYEQEERSRKEEERKREEEGKRREEMIQKLNIENNSLSSKLSNLSSLLKQTTLEKNSTAFDLKEKMEEEMAEKEEELRRLRRRVKILEKEKEMREEERMLMYEKEGN